MKNVTQHTGKFEIVERLNNSRNGNPRFIVCVDGFKCYTAVDSAHGYSVSNFEGKDVIATIGTHYGKPTLDTLKLA